MFFFYIISRYKPQKIWFTCYPNMKPVSYGSSDAVVPAQFDCYIKTQCLRNVSHFIILAEGIRGYFLSVPASQVWEQL